MRSGERVKVVAVGLNTYRAMEKILKEQEMENGQVEKVDFTALRESGVKYQPASKNIGLCTYGAAEKLLLIDFTNGTTYLYRNVGEDTWNELLDAESAGSYFHKHIRAQTHQSTPKFPFSKVKKDEVGLEFVEEPA